MKQEFPLQPEPYTYMAFLLLIFLLPSCAASVLNAPPYDFSRFRDSPIPPEALVWLESGEQSKVSPRIQSAANELQGRNRRQSLCNAVQFLWQALKEDWWHNPEAFRTTADEIFERGVLGGCSDYALVQITLFRTLGIPSKLVVTANVDWMQQFRMNRLSLTEGHCFIEVFLEDRWFLFDSTFRYLYTDYDPDRFSYPHGEVLCKKGRDFWDMGIRNIGDFDAALRELALSYDGGYREPGYPRHPI